MWINARIAGAPPQMWINPNVDRSTHRSIDIWVLRLGLRAWDARPYGGLGGRRVFLNWNYPLQKTGLPI
jgi:hypothetical protein